MVLTARPEPARDPRAQRTRTVLMRAAVDLVSERGTAAITMSDIAEAANVSRKAAYQQFGDRDALLLQTALDLVRCELIPALAALPSGRARMLTNARHFAGYRAFYRPVLLSAAGLPLSRELSHVLAPITRESLVLQFGDTVSAETIADLTTTFVGGSTALLIRWLVEDDEPLDPVDFTDRYFRVQSLVLPPGRTMAG
ncbi:TetR/AcrR family transcriptional regulator [Mycolicibacterium fluoranthenivorans]|jgi:AcrR family transcriptional regulator|uniref:TetR/AcrR family transcriptional regulator n=1 Tax=Mycolicibacterium fluoranthenivorans TaxID=258505 RepID=A0A7G8PGV8_9MYCO|nr:MULTISPECIES: TetR/AcrR family transcriptional regulator [Mycobacteriaceae]MCV7253271.1 TetR/AcrR family transcriptional regulator [Mycobacterium hackensackense]QNJ93574.1 TetR/AcrR family transcriptional regulator [Mycolicibacterium fluoranthenivorans]